MISQNRDPFTGFWVKMDFYLNGGVSNGIRYDIQGNPLGMASFGGTGPDVSPTKILKISSLFIKQGGVWKWAVNGRIALNETLKKFGLQSSPLCTTTQVSKLEKAF